MTARDYPGNERRRVLLVCSPGGHLQQMLALEPAWRGFSPTWVTLPAPDVQHLLKGQDVLLAHGPTNRSVAKFVRNMAFAWRTVRDRDPHAILSTGAGLAAPFFIVGRLLGRRVVYVESLTRIKSLSLTGRLVYPLANAFFVQWPRVSRRRRVQYKGNVF
jgi:beta-1,4-N-acetylglucosaminyltransferase